jgi:hypothetical protein
VDGNRELLKKVNKKEKERKEAQEKGKMIDIFVYS